MITKIPKHWLNNSQIPEIVNAIQPEIDNIQDIIEDFWAQIFIDTATWALPYWERDYGLTANANDTIENRRSAVKAQMRGAQTVTLPVLQSIADVWCNNVTVEDTGHAIHLDFAPDSNKKNMYTLIKAVRDTMPAHLPLLNTINLLFENTIYFGSAVQIADTINVFTPPATIKDTGIYIATTVQIADFIAISSNNEVI